MTTLVQLSQSETEPVSLDEAKVHLRVDDNASDLLILGLVSAAREWAEVVTRRALVETTYRLDLPRWPACGVLTLPRPPLKTLTHVKYYDAANALQTWASDQYQVSAPIGPWAPRATIQPGDGIVLPTTSARVDAVQVTFVAGYASCPRAIKAAILLLIAHLFENREPINIGNITTELPFSVKALLSPYVSREVWP